MKGGKVTISSQVTHSIVTISALHNPLLCRASTASGASCHTYFEEMKAVWAKKGVFVLIAPLEYTTLNLFIENSVALLLGVYR